LPLAPVIATVMPGRSPLLGSDMRIGYPAAGRGTGLR
jgi:hypothetical protein